MGINDPLDPFGAHRDDVLALQSYAPAAAGVDCVSDVSCISTPSCISGLSGKGVTIATSAVTVE